MSEFLNWLNREIALHEAAGDEEIDTSVINPVPEVFKMALNHVHDCEGDDNTENKKIF